MPDVLFTVDPDGLDSLRRQLDRIGSGLQEIGQVAGSYHPLELGPDPAVWDALQHFDAARSEPRLPLSILTVGIPLRGALVHGGRIAAVQVPGIANLIAEPAWSGSDRPNPG